MKLRMQCEGAYGKLNLKYGLTGVAEYLLTSSNVLITFVSVTVYACILTLIWVEALTGMVRQPR